VPSDRERERERDLLTVIAADTYSYPSTLEG
jgi:hypothetical protein